MTDEEKEKGREEKEKEKVEKESKIEKITNLEFTKNLLSQINLAEKDIRECEDNYSELIRTYKQFIYDKRNYILRFFRKDTVLYYTKIPREKIGFKK